MSLTAAELRAVYVVDETPLDRSLAGIPGKVAKVKPSDVKIDGDDKGLQRAAASAEKRMGRLSTSMKTAVGAIAGYFAFDVVTRFIGDSITAASDLAETVNKSNTIFGQNAQVVNDWARGSARSVGLSRQAALGAAASFGDMFTQIGFAGDEAAKLSTQVVQMSADLGSFNNLPTADVADRISAAFRGEYDSLQTLIPNINAARVETEAMAATGKKNAAELTAQEKAAAVLAIVQKDGARAMGDFARTSDGLANKQKILSAQWEDAKARLGALLVGPLSGIVGFIADTGIPAFEGFIRVVGGILGVFAGLPGPVKTALVAVAAFVALRGPLDGFFTTLSGRITGFATGMGMAAKNAGGLRGALGGLVGAINPVTLGIGLLAAGVTQYLQDSAEVEARMDAAADAGESLGEAFASQAGELSNVTREAAKAALETAGLTEAMEALHISAGTVNAALTGNREAYESTRKALQDYDVQQSVTNSGFSAIGIGMDVLSGKVSENTDAFDAMYASMLQQEALSTLEGIFGGIGEAARGGATFVADLATNTEAYAESAEAAAEQANALKTALDILNGGQLDLNDAQRNFQQSLADVQERLQQAREGAEGYSTSLDITTQAGRENREALDGIATSAADLANSIYNTTGDYGQFRAALEGSRQDLFNNAMAFYGSEDAAWAYVDSVLAIPDEAVVNTSAPGATQSEAELRRVRDAVKNVPPNKEVDVGVLSDAAMKRLQELGFKVHTLPSGRVAVSAQTAQAEKDLAWVTRPRTIRASVVVTNTPEVRAIVRVGQVVREAQGGILKFFAGGGVHRENHVAQIAPAGAMRVWAERETGGELYAPLALAKRARSLAVIGTQLAEWGYAMVPTRSAGLSARIPVGAAAPAAAAARPADTGSADRGPLFHADSVTVIEGTPDDVARQLELGARTRGHW